MAPVRGRAALKMRQQRAVKRSLVQATSESSQGGAFAAVCYALLCTANACAPIASTGQVHCPVQVRLTAHRCWCG